MKFQAGELEVIYDNLKKKKNFLNVVCVQANSTNKAQFSNEQSSHGAKRQLRKVRFKPANLWEHTHSFNQRKQDEQIDYWTIKVSQCKSPQGNDHTADDR